MMSSYDSPFRPIILSCSAVEVWILTDVYFSSAMCIYNYRCYATYGVFMFLAHYQGGQKRGFGVLGFWGFGGSARNALNCVKLSP